MDICYWTKYSVSLFAFKIYKKIISRNKNLIFNGFKLSKNKLAIESRFLKIITKKWKLYIHDFSYIHDFIFQTTQPKFN